MNIQEQVNQFKCPDPNDFCVVATECFEEEDRQKICLRCWEEHLKESEKENG